MSVKLLQELLDDDPTQTQRQLAEVLHVSKETIGRHLQAMGKINKLVKWVHTILINVKSKIAMSLVKCYFKAMKVNHFNFVLIMLKSNLL
jgi:DeoR/GlpR family transcriptional regulator of sugar metabolism